MRHCILFMVLAGCSAPTLEPVDVDAHVERTSVPLDDRLPLPTWAVMPPGQLEEALQITREAGADVPDDVRVMQTTAPALAALAGRPTAYGYHRAGWVWVLHGEDLCERPAEYDGRLLGWVLSHELAHAAGWPHGREMTQITDKAYQLWLVRCQRGQERNR